MFALISAVIVLLLGIIDGISGIKLLTSLYSLFIVIPELSLSFRRLHDINKSAWWLLIAFVPVIGAIVLLVFSLKPGTVGTNNYGDYANPTNLRKRLYRIEDAAGIETKGLHAFRHTFATKLINGTKCADGSIKTLNIKAVADIAPFC